MNAHAITSEPLPGSAVGLGHALSQHSGSAGVGLALCPPPLRLRRVLEPARQPARDDHEGRPHQQGPARRPAATCHPQGSTSTTAATGSGP